MDASGGAATPDAGSGTTLAERATCAAFLPLWEVRQNERESGSPSPGNAASAPCFNCLEAHAGECQDPVSEACKAASACVDRHCLCEKSGFPTCGAQDYPSELCRCVQTCESPAGGCYNAWLNYMACETAACADSCAP